MSHCTFVIDQGASRSRWSSMISVILFGRFSRYLMSFAGAISPASTFFIISPRLIPAQTTATGVAVCIASSTARRVAPTTLHTHFIHMSGEGGLEDSIILIVHRLYAIIVSIKKQNSPLKSDLKGDTTAISPKNYVYMHILLEMLDFLSGKHVFIDYLQTLECFYIYTLLLVAHVR